MSSPHASSFDDPKGKSRLKTTHNLSEPDPSNSPCASILKRRGSRSRRFKTRSNNTAQAGCHPGQEQGLEHSWPNGGRSRRHTLDKECQITVVDFSEEDICTRDMDSAQLIAFLQEDQESWIKCRWINVNGLSWDVIQALGKYKRLDIVALEDLANTVCSATNAHWYVDNTYIVLTLQKLVDLGLDQEGSDFDLNDKLLYSLREGRKGHNGEWFSKAVHNSNETPVVGVEKPRMLPRSYRAPNQQGMDYKEANSVLTQKRLAVSAERVSIFLTADNTVISFFESSADDIEIPILNRLSTADTILRQSCDAAMITQVLEYA
ncbi:hypothetical protein VF21_07841 [Pseudogymnoascus sp. 05NY08]|nr:hypothetical protein VF21_07841 [Pseudogymnoascus sp. 05NY08]